MNAISKELILLLILLPIMSCYTTFNDYNGKFYKIVGISKNSSLQIMGVGKPRGNESNVSKRKIQSKEAAIIMAQRGAIEYLRKHPNLMKKQTQIKMGSLSEFHFSGIIRNGVILNIQWDEKQNCQILYEIQLKNK